MLYLGLTLAGLQTYPTVWVDEGWIAEPAWQLAQGEDFGNPSHGSRYRYDDRVYWMPPLQFLALAGAYQLPGSPLLTGRLVSVGAGLATLLLLLTWLPSVMTTGRKRSQLVTSQSLGWAALALTLLFTLDPMLWKSHRTIRFEALGTLWITATVVWGWDPARRLRGPLCGLAMGLAVLVHPHGALAAVAGAGVLVLCRRSAGSAVRDVLWAALAAGLVVAPFILYLLGDRPNDFANVLGQNAPHLEGRGEPVIVQWIREWVRYQAYFALPALVLPLVAWGAALILGIRRAPLPLLWVVGVLVGGLASLPNKTELYLTLVAPFVMVLALWLAVRCSRPRWMVAAVSVWVLNLAAADAALLWRNRGCDYGAWGSSLAQGIPPGSQVGGSFLVWFPLRDRQLLEVHRHRAGDLADARPEFVIWGDRHLEEPMFDRLREELGPFLATHADTVATAQSPCYGTTCLLRVNWDRLPPETSTRWERYGGETEPASSLETP